MRSNWPGSLLTCLFLAGCGGGGGATANAPTGSASPPNSLSVAADGGFPATKAAESGYIEPGTTKAPAPSPFSREHTYRVYAANGSQKVLRLDLASRRYEMLDLAGIAAGSHSTSGSFSEDADEPGTYVFSHARRTAPVNTARFRFAQGAVIGAFPFERVGASPVAYAVVPFVAVNDFVTVPADLDGEYNRVGVSLINGGAADSQVVPVRISAGGTVLETCGDDVIHRVDLCPPASRRLYGLSATADATWTATNAGAPADGLQFRMARIEGHNVMLSGGTSFSNPSMREFRIGLRDAGAWPAARHVGASTEETWETDVLDAVRSVRSTIAPDGTSDVQDLPISSAGAMAPAGLRRVSLSGARSYYATRDGVLAVVVGARDPGSRGYLQIGLFKEAADVYKVFATNGTRLDLHLDMEAGTYLMRDSSGEEHTGAFSADPAEPGTYIFASPRITTPANTARFRLAENVVLGGFPFVVTQSATTSYAVQPFVGSRALETRSPALAGTYNRFGIDVPATNPSSNISQFVINGQGTALLRCMDNTIYRVDNCPASALQDWSVGATGSPGIWRMTELAHPDNYALFAVTRLGGQKVFLLAGKLVGDPMASVFRIGLTESSSWPTGRGYGISTKSSSGMVRVEADHSTRAALLTDGTITNTDNPLSRMNTQAPRAMRGIHGNPENYFAMQGARIYAIVGANAPGSAGYLQLNLMD